MKYFDSASTTKISSEALLAFVQASESFCNPSALYAPAIESKRIIESAREYFLKFFSAPRGSTFIFTGSASESNNAVLNSVITRKDKKYIFSSSEHSSIHNAAKAYLERGFNVVFIPLKSNGGVDLNALERELDESVALVSIIHVSNETGAINDIKHVVELVRAKCKNAFVHSDGVQVVGKFAVNLSELGVDFYSVSAHKINGPKGVGALYIKNPNKFKPFLIGGAQEGKLRAGTENVAGIASFKTALETLKIHDFSIYKKAFLENLTGDFYLVSNEDCVDNIISVCFKGVRAETIVHMLESKGYLIGTGSACNSGAKINRVISDIVPKIYAEGAVRVSFGADITIDDCKNLAIELSATVREYVGKIRH